MAAPASWLLLRGLAREQRHWEDFPATLERTLGAARVHRLDLPGAGTECGRASPLSVPAIAEDVRRRWLALRDCAQGPWGILGISLGGMVSVAWCAAHPGDFARLVVVSSSVSDLSPAWRRMSLGSAANVLRLLASTDGAARERVVLAMTTRRCHDAQARAAKWASYHQERPVRRANVLRQIVAASRLRAPQSLSTPMLVLVGDRDALCHPSCSRAIAERYGAPLRVHAGGGHDLSTDAPEWMAEQVRDWTNGAR